MPKLPANMIHRSDRPGFWFRRVRGGRVQQRYLGTDFQQALERWRSLTTEPFPPKPDQPPVREVVRSAGPDRLRVREAVERWLSEYVATSRKEKDQRLARVRAGRYLVPFLGDYAVAHLGERHLRRYRLDLDALTISAQTVRHVLSDCRCFLRWCERQGCFRDSETRRSPFPPKLLPRVDERPAARLTDGEADKLKSLPEPYGFVCRLALGTGLRWGELCRAQASDVEARGFLVVHRTKSSKLRRIPLGPELLREVRKRVGRLVPFSEKSCGTFNRKVRLLAGIEGFHAHRMRHTYASAWVEQGKSLAALQKILGHQGIATTERYAKMSDEAVQREALKGELSVPPEGHGVPQAAREAV